VTPQAVASVATRLEGRSQLERRPHPRHRHVQELHLTDTGRDALRKADSVIAEIEQQITEKLGAKDSTQLQALLGQVTDAIPQVQPVGSSADRSPCAKTAHRGDRASSQHVMASSPWTKKPGVITEPA
jgi:hypothetical protein